LKICVQSSRPPSFSSLKRFIVVVVGVGRRRHRHLLSDRCRCPRFLTLPTKVCSIQQTPPRQLPICSVLGLVLGGECASFGGGGQRPRGV
jgi:hypothetical protein